MELRLTRTERRFAVLGTFLTGLAHLLVPELLIDLVRFTYGATLDVSFVSRDETARRVRLLGLGCCLLALALRFVPLEE